MDAIRVFVVDDHPLIRHGLASMLGAERGVRWVGEANDGPQALREAPGLAPNVVVLDLDMPGMDGIATLMALRPLLPQARYLMLDSALQAPAVRRAQAAGATGFLLKDASAPELVRAIRATHNGQISMPNTLTQALNGHGRNGSIGGDLTLRERELLSLMARGLSNQEISTQLSIAMPTVKFHVTNILTKMHADNRTGAVLAALRHRIVDLQ